MRLTSSPSPSHAYSRFCMLFALVVLAIVLLAISPRLAQAAPVTPIPIGTPLTDAQLRAVDPAGYAEITKGRAALERSLLTKLHRALDAKGLRYGGKLTATQIDAANYVAAAIWSPYGYLRFKLVPGTGDWSYNGYKGTLYFTYGIYNPTVDAYKWYTVSWPAISGNNRPSYQNVPNVGPIPEYTWDFGFLGTTWQGYVSNTAAEFSPGEWRLNPWTNAPYGRCYFETHGGTGSHYFKPTHGCIRLTPSNITSLKSYYDTKMANKKDRSTADLTVTY